MKIYEPDEQAALFAPAAICGVVSRVIRARAVISKLDIAHDKNIPHELRIVLLDLISPFPFEKEIMSGNMEQVDNAIKNLGKNASKLLQLEEFNNSIEISKRKYDAPGISIYEKD